MTREQFIEFIRQGGHTKDCLDDWGFTIVPCLCGESKCKGWQARLPALIDPDPDADPDAKEEEAGQ